jgi:hypothetical protein
MKSVQQVFVSKYGHKHAFDVEFMLQWSLKTEHNNIMYEWSSHQQNLLLITGLTHQPIFESLTYLERVQRQEAMMR